MKKTNLFISLLTVPVLLLSGCSVMQSGTRYEEQGKVYRSVVIKQFQDLSQVDEGLTGAKVKFDKARDGGIRAAGVRIRIESVYPHKEIIGNVFLVPDNVEFSQIGIGAIVDVILQPGDNVDFSKRLNNRIVKVICNSDEDACIDAEMKSGRMKMVVDENPGDDMAAYKNTYMRNVSPDEYEKYSQ
jgi:hypothetical protein